jgi:hypothetical protein
VTEASNGIHTHSIRHEQKSCGTITIMQVTKTTYLSLLVIIVATVVGVVALLLLVLAPAPSLDSELIATQFGQYQASAEVHLGRYTNYDGLCVDITTPDAVSCQATEAAYRFSQLIEPGQYYCADSTGYAGIVERVPSGLRCF